MKRATKIIRGFAKTDSVRKKINTHKERVEKTEKPLKNKSDVLNNNNIIASITGAPYIVFALDSTGSMSTCIDECRRNLKDLIAQLLQTNPRIRIGMVMFGDYCDDQYCISIHDFCGDAEELHRFINETTNTNGGDIPECYELVLNRVADMEWMESGGALVLVGDSYPHPIQDFNPKNNPEHLDWRNEIQRLLKKNIKVFPCQCLYNKLTTFQEINRFWQEIADICETPLLKMEFKDSSMTLGAIAYMSTHGSKGLDHFASTYACNIEGSSSLKRSITSLKTYCTTVKTNSD